MREIKFRAWDVNTKEMYYDTRFCMQAIADERYAGYGEDLELMQYTGLKDSKGHEIFEGDIIHDERTGRIKGYVLYDRGAFRLQRIKELESRWLNDLAIWHYLKPPHAIIGNIYENPELLK